MTKKSITAFVEQIKNMKDPRKRRGFVDSFYARLVHGDLYNEGPEAVELASDLVGKYLSPTHAEKLKYLRFKESLRKCDINKDVIKKVISRTNYQEIKDRILAEIVDVGDSIVNNQILLQAIIYSVFARYRKQFLPNEEFSKSLEQLPCLKDTTKSNPTSQLSEKYLRFREALKKYDINDTNIEKITEDNYQEIRDKIFKDIVRLGDTFTLVGDKCLLIQSMIYRVLKQYRPAPSLYARFKQIVANPTKQGIDNFLLENLDEDCKVFKYIMKKMGVKQEDLEGVNKGNFRDIIQGIMNCISMAIDDKKPFVPAARKAILEAVDMHERSLKEQLLIMQVENPVYTLNQRMQALIEDEKYEEAQKIKDQLERLPKDCLRMRELARALDINEEIIERITAENFREIEEKFNSFPSLTSDPSLISEEQYQQLVKHWKRSKEWARVNGIDPELILMPVVNLSEKEVFLKVLAEYE